MTASLRLKAPADCGPEELREFARLVRLGFDAVIETLDARIRTANTLAFHYAPDNTLVGIAALKAPDEEHRVALFRQAAAPVGGEDCKLDLGWVFVLPAHRGHGFAKSMCGALMARVPGEPVFGTTRPDNAFMIRILTGLGFSRVGEPYPRRDEELALFLRP